MTLPVNRIIFWDREVRLRTVPREEANERWKS